MTVREQLESKRTAIENEFNELQKRRQAELERMHQLQGAFFVVNEVIDSLNKAQKPKEKIDGRKSRRTKITVT